MPSSRVVARFKEAAVDYSVSAVVPDSDSVTYSGGRLVIKGLTKGQAADVAKGLKGWAKNVVQGMEASDPTPNPGGVASDDEIIQICKRIKNNSGRVELQKLRPLMGGSHDAQTDVLTRMQEEDKIVLMRDDAPKNPEETRKRDSAAVYFNGYPRHVLHLSR